MKMQTLFDIPVETDDKYSRRILPPQYLPSKVKPDLWELVDKSKYTEILRNINTSNIPDDIKDFLRLAATRHIVFNYSKIADYYAHADKDIQKLMEESALVIIDMNDAIVNGYVKLSNTIERIMDDNEDKTYE